MANTLIITLKIDAEAQTFFEEKRNHYFPKHCNFVPAHLTFFHAAPNTPAFITSLNKAVNKSELTLNVASIFPFKNGMAYSADNEYLQAIHGILQEEFMVQLSGKDKKLWKPHITVQNKVTEFKAQKCYRDLQQNFKPFTFKAEGFNGYIYTKQKWAFSFFIPFLES